MINATTATCGMVQSLRQINNGLIHGRRKDFSSFVVTANGRCEHATQRTSSPSVQWASNNRYSPIHRSTRFTP